MCHRRYSRFVYRANRVRLLISSCRLEKPKEPSDNSYGLCNVGGLMSEGAALFQPTFINYRAVYGNYWFVFIDYFSVYCFSSFGYFLGKKRLGFLKSQLIAFLLPVIIPTIFIAFLILSSENVEYNPIISDKSALVGTWADRDYRLVLRNDRTFTIDGAFTINRTEASFTGNWTLTDFNMTLTGSPYEYLRVIQVGKDYQLLKNSKAKDPDDWNTKDIFVRK